MPPQTFRSPRGLNDLLPADLPAFQRLERVAHDLAGRFGYREIRPPLLEETALFVRSVGEATDIVEKEMFTIERADHSFTLRPEGTAGVARAYIQAGYAKTGPFQKLYYVGPMFRYERPQKGRERQFTQFGIECLGSEDPRLDAEAIDLAVSFFRELGITGVVARVNSMGDGEDRDRYREAVREFIQPNLERYSADSQRRFERNVLRVLDSKETQDIALNEGAPRLLDYLSDENREHFEAVQTYLADLGVAVEVDPTIVRGLDYYTRTVFELHYDALGARSALCGGGRYDGLVEELGGTPTPAVGFAIGFTGTLIALKELGLAGDITNPPAEVYVAAADEESRGAVLKLAAELRAGGLSAIFDAEGRKLKAQFKQASKGGHPLVCVLGQNEVLAGTVQLKDMRSSDQNDVPRDAIVARALAALGR